MMTLPRTISAGYAVVDKAITPHQRGRIKFQGSYWNAALAEPNCRGIEVGETAQVVGVQGMTQLVVPEGYEFSMRSQKKAEDWQRSRSSSFTCWTQKCSSLFATTLG